MTTAGLFNAPKLDFLLDKDSDPILRAHDIRCGGEQWLASAALCEPLGEPAAVLLHKDGLVAIG